ncbi:hypothetical protein D1816_01410 [Aquimarina sp. AD10]|uniref:tail fiber protein n=1 Tax=Aquimarina sp. AD10 TaxID=1714849 RepID=UPI000E55700D|nr:tail fiber protein [Aquimarina sp. AD10]AXT59062.1 hypothetical protein D1816_01410 [Aquimarina sp. AD10]RKM93395.1 hypothetical protein D7033_19865 [Aquimarina sp. AD10]
MKKILTIILLLGNFISIQAQITELPNGNVGIGTTTPLDKFDIHQGGLTLSTPNQGIGYGKNLNGITWVVDDDSAGRISETAAAIRFLGTSNWNGSTSPSLLSFETIGAAGEGTVQRMIIDHKGNVGIGTNNPFDKFDIHQGGITLSTPNQGIANGKNLNGITWVVDDDSAGRISETAAAIRFLGTGNWNGSTSPSLLSFETIGVANSGTIQRMVIDHLGNVGIGTTAPDSKLTVKGKIHAEEIKVDLSVPAPDYVFKKDYDLLTIAQVQQHIKEKGHLPNIPSAKVLETEGVDLGLMNMKLLEKIEELTLYTIDQENKIKKLENQSSKIEDLEKKITLLITQLKK